ncbi:hypothetical protein QNE83_002723 [Vibrio alginolyticus]|nr:hypothetical protein [Vibrio alginolyticus]ELB2869857.1 hypothetical protein [Vibrio alginolyticus]
MVFDPGDNKQDREVLDTEEPIEFAVFTGQKLQKYYLNLGKGNIHRVPITNNSHLTDSGVYLGVKKGGKSMEWLRFSYPFEGFPLPLYLNVESAKKGNPLEAESSPKIDYLREVVEKLEESRLEHEKSKVNYEFKLEERIKDLESTITYTSILEDKISNLYKQNAKLKELLQEVQLHRDEIESTLREALHNSSRDDGNKLEVVLKALDIFPSVLKILK